MVLNSRSSARLAQARAELSSDDESAKKTVADQANAKGGSQQPFFLVRWLSKLDWLLTLFFILLGPVLMLSLHLLARDGVYKVKVRGIYIS